MKTSTAVEALRHTHLPRLLLVDDLEEMLGLSRATVLRYLKRGVIPGSKIGRTWVVTRDVLLKHLDPSVPSVPSVPRATQSAEDDFGFRASRDPK